VASAFGETNGHLDLSDDSEKVRVHVLSSAVSRDAVGAERRGGFGPGIAPSPQTALSRRPCHAPGSDRLTTSRLALLRVLRGPACGRGVGDRPSDGGHFKRSTDMNMHTNLLRVVAKIKITAFPPTKNDTAPKGNRKAKKAWPDNKRAEVEIEFLDGFLANSVLRGITIWETKDGELSVTPPNRKYKNDKNEDVYYDYLHAKGRLDRETFAEFVIAEYRRAIELKADLAGSTDDEAPGDD
jgi:hypothetical protein